MSLIADGLLIATALTAALYCHVLARRLRRLGNLDEGLGARIAALDTTLGETRTALSETQQRIEQIRSGATSASERLKRDIAKARRIIEELEEMSRSAEGTLKRLFDVGDLNGTAAERIEIVSASGLDMLIDEPAAATRHDRDGPGLDGERQAAPAGAANGAPSGAVPVPVPVPREARLPKVGRIEL